MTGIVLAPFEVFESSPRAKDELLVRTSRGDFVSVTPKLLQLMQIIDGLTPDEAAPKVAASTGACVTPADVTDVVERFLRPNGLLADSDVAQRPALSFSKHWKVLARDPATAVARRLACLYRPPVPAVVAMLFVAALAATLFSGMATTTPFAHLEFAQTIGIVLASFVFHELGHAAAAAYFGCETRAIGVGLYLTRPVLYADLTEAWRLPPRERVVIDLGGVYFQCIVQVPLAGAALLLHSQMLVATYEMLLVALLANLNPFLKLDGYWVIVDRFGWTNIPGHALDGLRWLTSLRAGRARRHASKAAFLYSMGYLVTSIGFLAVGLSQLPSAVNRLLGAFQHGWTVGTDGGAAFADRVLVFAQDVLVPSILVLYAGLLGLSAMRRLRFARPNLFTRRRRAS